MRELLSNCYCFFELGTDVCYLVPFGRNICYAHQHLSVTFDKRLLQMVFQTGCE